MISQGEDGESPRRLFYVAMTRARRSLAVVTSGAHAFVRADSDSELLRKVDAPRRSELPEPDQYQLPEMGSVDLSFAGRLAEASQTLAAIAEAQIGDKLTLERRDGKWLIVDAQGRTLGRMAGTWSPPEGTRLISGLVGTIVRWRRADSGEAFQTFIKRDDWETILPEFVFRRSAGL
jgi:ATP-dependent DNA helicase RecQ